MKPILFFASLFTLFSSCESNSNKRAVDAKDLDKVIAEEKKQAPEGPQKSALTATEFIALYGCKDLPCVQLFMKEHSRDFVHAQKGEFASVYRTAVADTAGKQLVMPLSTVYVSVDPGAEWRMKHTLHSPALNEQMLREFAKAKFSLEDSVVKAAAVAYHYRSTLYPGLVLTHTKTFQPWRARGLYNRPVTWQCYVFELATKEE